MRTNRGFTTGELGCAIGILALVVIAGIGVPIGGAYLVIAAANILFHADWPYDAQHVAVIAGIIFLAAIVFGGSRARGRSTKE
jgi:hypothetical protein